MDWEIQGLVVLISDCMTQRAKIMKEAPEVLELLIELIEIVLGIMVIIVTLSINLNSLI